MTRLSHLRELEAESIHVLREVTAECERPALLYSMGKDSSVLLRLAQKAFFPTRPPFPALFVDTTFKFPAMYAHLERSLAEAGLEQLTFRSPEGQRQGANPFDLGVKQCCATWKTQGLLQALALHGIDAAFGGARRDEERSRAKERIYSFRDARGQWDPKAQRPELWNLYNGRKHPGETLRVFPLSNWTELDVWEYVQLEAIPLVPLYFARERAVIEREGALILADPRALPRAGEVVEHVWCRFRSLGCVPCTGAIRSQATTLPLILEELRGEVGSERAARLIDRGDAMEVKKREGYF